MAAAAAAPPAPPLLTAAEAVQQAEAEGLTLLKADTSSGYKGVCWDSHCSRTKPYKVKVRRDGKQVYLSYFATAEEAALSYARPPENRAASRKRGLAEVDDCEADAIMVEAHELMDSDGNGDGPWDEDICVVEAVIVEPEGAALWHSRKRKIKSPDD